MLYFLGGTHFIFVIFSETPLIPTQIRELLSHFIDCFFLIVIPFFDLISVILIYKNHCSKYFTLIPFLFLNYLRFTFPIYHFNLFVTFVFYFVLPILLQSIWNNQYFVPFTRYFHLWLAHWYWYITSLPYIKDLFYSLQVYLRYLFYCLK